MSRIIEQLKVAADLTRQQLQATNNDDWQLVEELEENRKNLLHSVLDGKITDHRSNEIVEQIKKIRQTEREILKLTQEKQQAIKGDIKNANVGSKAHNAYKNR